MDENSTTELEEVVSALLSGLTNGGRFYNSDFFLCFDCIE
jgi:hypothetical protein